MKKDLNALKEGNGKPGVRNSVTEFLANPQFWRLDNPKYDWLSDKDREMLENEFDFDFGDLLEGCRHWMDMGQIQDWLMVGYDEIDRYCQILWKKEWNVIWKALITEARRNVMDRVYEPWSEQGNAVAMGVVRDVSKVTESKDDKDRQVTVRLVNDIEA